MRVTAGGLVPPRQVLVATYVGIAAALGVSLLTLYSMAKIWSGVFWGDPEEKPSSAPQTTGVLGAPLGMLTATGFLAIVSIAIAVGAGPIYELSERAAADLLDPSEYVEAVLGGGS